MNEKWIKYRKINLLGDNAAYTAVKCLSKHTTFGSSHSTFNWPQNIGRYKIKTNTPTQKTEIVSSSSEKRLHRYYLSVQYVSTYKTHFNKQFEITSSLGGFPLSVRLRNQSLFVVCEWAQNVLTTADGIQLQCSPHHRRRRRYPQNCALYSTFACFVEVSIHATTRFTTKLAPSFCAQLIRMCAIFLREKRHATTTTTGKGFCVA